MSLLNLEPLYLAENIFFDFDGVIKESVGVKSAAFQELFSSYGEELMFKIKLHHEANGGLSRFEKVPLYLTWAGLPNDPRTVENYCSRFSSLVLENVIDSPWVLGIEEFLRRFQEVKEFYVVTSTPQGEIDLILDRLKIKNMFSGVFGFPHEKHEVILKVLAEHQSERKKWMMIGDSELDYAAAQRAGVEFLLRITDENARFRVNYRGPTFRDFKNG